MNVKGMLRSVKTIETRIETFFNLVDGEGIHPDNRDMAMWIQRRRIRDAIWKFRSEAGIGNDSPFLPGDQIMGIAVKGKSAVEINSMSDHELEALATKIQAGRGLEVNDVSGRFDIPAPRTEERYKGSNGDTEYFAGH